MKFTVKELQSVPPTSPNFTLAISILAKLGVLDFLEKNTDVARKQKLEKEINELSQKLYLPKVNDIITYESKITGIRYKCEITSIEGNCLIGKPTSFILGIDGCFIFDVIRDKKNIYRW